MRHRFSKKAHRATKPFEGKIRQMQKEHLILINLSEFEDFKKALGKEEIEYDLGDFFGDGIIVMEK